MTKRQRRYVLPTTVGLLDEHQLFHQNIPPAGKLRPALVRYFVGSARFRVIFGFQNREMRNIGPNFRALESPAAKLIVQFTHAISRPLYLDKYRRGSWQKCFHISQFDCKRNDARTGFFEKFQGRLLRGPQLPRRKNGEMGRHVLGGGMEFLAQVFYKLANRIAQVRHQCVA